jgi:hypothetical protein
MKIWNKLKFTKQLVDRNKNKWLKKNGINEEIITDDLKYLIECKELLKIWHTEEQIIDWVKKEQLERRMEIEKDKRGEIIKTKETLINKEILKDVNNNDHLILTFENLKRKLIIFPKSLKNRWNELEEGKKYKIMFAIQTDGKHEKDILLNFIKQNENKKQKKQ